MDIIGNNEYLIIFRLNFRCLIGDIIGSGGNFKGVILMQNLKIR